MQYCAVQRGFESTLPFLSFSTVVQCSPTTAPLAGGNLVQTLPSGVATWPTIGIGMGNKILDNIYNMLYHAKNQICSFQMVDLVGG